ncbi:RNA recognition motif domain-containing protein [Ditylenchus destructor]|nr:RNA recognition motif domain-containing protein [Ditylenchus destructor]
MTTVKKRKVHRYQRKKIIMYRSRCQRLPTKIFLQTLKPETTGTDRFLNQSTSGSMCPKTTPSISNSTQKCSKNLEFRKYHIAVNGFSQKKTQNAMREFYSQFGEIVTFRIQQNPWFLRPQAIVVFRSKEAMERAVNSSPHRIKDEEVSVQIGTDPLELTLRLLNLSPKTTQESLKEFYSRFGNVSGCNVNNHAFGYVTFASQDELDRALDTQPHVLDDSEVFLKYKAGYLDLQIKGLPAGITEESLYDYFSQHGQLRHCHLVEKNDCAHAYLSFSTLHGATRALEDRPHITDIKVREPNFVSKRGIFAVFVGSLPENATAMSLYTAFRRFGKIISMVVINDGRMNQPGPYGFVTYRTGKEVEKVLDSCPHMVEGVTVNVRAPNFSRESEKSFSE